MKEKEDGVYGSVSRRGFMLGAGAVGLGVIQGLVPAEAADKKPGVIIHNREVFGEIRKDENQHVDFIISALQAAGGKVRPKPSFKGLEQPTYAEFLKAADALENTGVGAYLGAIRAISDKGILAAAASIMTVEARHAGYLNILTNQNILTNAAPGSRDTLLIQDAAIAAFGIFVDNINSDDPDFQPKALLNNDVNILNFALLLEYLESTFYNINVPKFLA